jgi:hypothetical protein
VPIVIGPDPVNGGTAVERLVEVTDDTADSVAFSLVRSFAATVSKFAPVTEMLVPPVPMLGVKLVMIGALPGPTVKFVALFADPFGEVTAIVPVLAPVGTVTTSFVVVALETVAPVPLKVTVFWLGVAENPVP